MVCHTELPQLLKPASAVNFRVPRHPAKRGITYGRRRLMTFHHPTYRSKSEHFFGGRFWVGLWGAAL